MDKKRLSELVHQSDAYNAYESDEVLTWCGGCGNYSIQNALKRALVLQKIPPHKTLMCFDIGCHGNGSDKIEGYTIHGLHGRVLPLAAGASMTVDPDIKVMAFAGDGGTMSEGINHLIHTVRSNYPFAFFHHDNQNYALTTGQPSATTKKGCPMNAAPQGVMTDPINTLQLVLSLEPSFVAQTLSADIDHMTDVFQKALCHQGFAFVNILQGCPTYNREATNEWYLRHVQRVEEQKDYDPTDIWAARRIVAQKEKIPLGILFLDTAQKDFLHTLPDRDPASHFPTREVIPRDITEFLSALE